jgi:hypothetical protein
LAVAAAVVDLDLSRLRRGDAGGGALVLLMLTFAPKSY